MAIDKKQRKEAEKLIFEVYDAMDKTHTNSEYYKKVFANMNDAQFEKLFKQNFPLRFHYQPWEIEPTIGELEKAAKLVDLPILQKVNMPYKYINKDGKPVQSKECLVIHLHIKKVQQFLTKKNAMSTNIEMRDMKTGLLISADKNGKTSDREAETLITMDLDDTVREFTGFKADNMTTKNIAYNLINNTGQVSLKDLEDNNEDYMSLNLLNVYMIGSMMYTNIISETYLLPYYEDTRRSKSISRV